MKARCPKSVKFPTVPSNSQNIFTAHVVKRAKDMFSQAFHMHHGIGHMVRGGRWSCPLGETSTSPRIGH